MKRRTAYLIFYLLSVLWGLPLTLAGAAAFAVLRAAGVPARRFGPCLTMTVGRRWGGLSLGPFLFTDPEGSKYLLLHESGHAVQNVLFGPLTPFLVSLPSAVRYWIRTAGERRGRTFRRRYEDAWFERQATRLGKRWIGDARGSLLEKAPPDPRENL